MSVVVLLRPLALASLAFISAVALQPAAAQQPYGAPVTYGTPYSAPPPPRASRRQQLGEPYRVSPYDRSARPGIWQGLYAGGNIGYVTGGVTPEGAVGTVDLSGGAIGGHAGYNWQFGSWVVGVEGDIAWNNADGTRSFAGPVLISAQNDWLMSARLRAGYSLGQALIYATGGIAWGNFDLSIADAFGSSRASDTLFGYVVGGGLEMKIAPNWSARVEGLYYGFGESDFRIGGGTVPVDAHTTTIRAGLTYHFN